jgi:hypothetical protein
MLSFSFCNPLNVNRARLGLYGMLAYELAE